MGYASRGAGKLTAADQKFWTRLDDAYHVLEHLTEPLAVAKLQDLRRKLGLEPPSGDNGDFNSFLGGPFASRLENPNRASECVFGAIFVTLPCKSCVWAPAFGSAFQSRVRGFAFGGALSYPLF